MCARSVGAVELARRAPLPGGIEVVRFEAGLEQVRRPGVETKLLAHGHIANRQLPRRCELGQRLRVRFRAVRSTLAGAHVADKIDSSRFRYQETVVLLNARAPIAAE